MASPPRGGASPVPTPARRSVVELLHTADVLRRRFMVVLAPYRVSLPQYNVLRILRGTRGAPLAASEIADRMIEQAVGTTSLLERMEVLGWIGRLRPSESPGVVLWRLTPGGEAMLDTLDPVLDTECEAVMAALDGEGRGVLALTLRDLRAAAVRPTG